MHTVTQRRKEREIERERGGGRVKINKLLLHSTSFCHFNYESIYNYNEDEHEMAKINTLEFDQPSEAKKKKHIYIHTYKHICVVI